MADTEINIFLDSEPGSYREGEHPRKPDGKFVPATEKEKDEPKQRKKAGSKVAALAKMKGRKPDHKKNPLSGKKRRLKAGILKKLKQLKMRH